MMKYKKNKISMKEAYQPSKKGKSVGGKPMKKASIRKKGKSTMKKGYK